MSLAGLDHLAVPAAEVLPAAARPYASVARPDGPLLIKILNKKASDSWPSTLAGAPSAARINLPNPELGWFSRVVGAPVVFK
jgi:hypothetical protein